MAYSSGGKEENVPMSPFSVAIHAHGPLPNLPFTPVLVWLNFDQSLCEPCQQDDPWGCLGREGEPGSWVAAFPEWT